MSPSQPDSPRQLWKYRELARNLVYRDMRLRYGGSRGGTLLGFLLSLLKPLLIVVVYLFGLHSVLRVSVENFPLLLGVGYLHWQLTVSAIQGSCQAVTSNANLVERACFPRILLPLTTVASEFCVFALTMLAFFALLFPWIGGCCWWGLLLYPLGLVLHGIFLLGMALICSAVQVFFHDFRDIVGFVLRLGFWLSPVIYASNRVPKQWRHTLFLINPAVPFIDFCRDLLCFQRLPSAQVWGMMALWACLLLPGMWIFRSWQRHFADEL